MSRLWPIILGVVLIKSFLLSAQTAGFACPDQSENAACDSYLELLRAEDKAVTNSGVRYVCFRDYADDFFTIQVGDPFLAPFQWYQWNKKLAKYTVKSPRDLPEAFSTIRTYRGGVGDDTQMPALFTVGKWIYLGFSPGGEMTFQAQPTRFDSGTKQQVRDSDTFFTMGRDQVEFSTGYTSVAKQRVRYSLILQRSTGRFRESFTFPNSPRQNSEGSGRCMEINALPKLPDPPELSEEQEAEKQKLDYCLDPPQSDEWSVADRNAYCASSFIYKDDYLAAPQKKGTTPPKK